MIDKRLIKKHKLTFEDLVEITMEATGEDEITAGFIVRMELDDIGPGGDVVDLTDNQQPDEVLPDDPPPDLV